MVRLEHANLVVKEFQPTLDFLQAAFPSWKIRGQGTMSWGAEGNNEQRQWLHFGDDDYYLTLNDNGQGEARPPNSREVGLAHLGFVVDNLAEIMHNLAKHNYQPAIISRDHPFRKSVYYNDPTGLQFEFLQYSSEQAEQKNMYGGESGDLKKS